MRLRKTDVTFDANGSDPLVISKSFFESLIARLEKLEKNIGRHIVSTGPPWTCDAAHKGFIYYEESLTAFMACDGGSTWKRLLDGPAGSINNPSKSCQDLKTSNPSFPSGQYWINPSNLPAFKVFFCSVCFLTVLCVCLSPVFMYSLSLSLFPSQVFCDQETAGGGWTKILHYTGAAYPVNVGAVGDVAVSGATSAFAKLSDAQINAVKSESGSSRSEFKFLGTGQDKTFFLRTPRSWIDTTNGFNLVNPITGVDGCLNTDYNACVWVPHNGYPGAAGYPILDTHDWINVENKCNR